MSGEQSMSVQSDQPSATKKEIFISLTSADFELARAIRAIMYRLFGNNIKVLDSTAQGAESGIEHGEDWLEWIAERIRSCDSALVLLTPLSAQKPWVLWEIGALYGMAVASGKEKLRRIRPVIYRVEDEKIPAPIRDMRFQYRRGDDYDDAKFLFQDIAKEYDRLVLRKQLLRGEKFDAMIHDYIKTVNSVLVKAPLFEMASRYLRINAVDWRERVRQKNDAANEMGKYINDHGIPKKGLTSFKNVESMREAIIVGLASAISERPEKDDIKLLLAIGENVKRYHVKFIIAVAINNFFEKVRVSAELIPDVERLLDRYLLNADRPLQTRMDQTRDTLELYRR